MHDNDAWCTDRALVSQAGSVVTNYTWWAAKYGHDSFYYGMRNTSSTGNTDTMYDGWSNVSEAVRGNAIGMDTLSTLVSFQPKCVPASGNATADSVVLPAITPYTVWPTESLPIT